MGWGCAPPGTSQHPRRFASLLAKLLEHFHPGVSIFLGSQAPISGRSGVPSLSG